MYSFLQKLKVRSESLGNHTRKYRRSIDIFGHALVQRLEKKGVIDRVHLWKEANNPSSEMDIILACSHSLQEKLDFGGCYYAIQFFHMNLKALDVLFLNLAAKQNMFSVFKDMQYQIGFKFRRLNTAYMEKVLKLFLDENDSCQFAICGVGTRVDQDDLDVGIIDDNSEKRKYLNLALARLNNEMLKWAIPLHFYLSQYVGEPGFTASIDEYNELLNREIHDFIIITEMIGAKYIMGDVTLFDEFEQKITDRYYFDEHRDNIFHEGYLRGILGEVRSLLLRQYHEDVLCPKEDAILMIRNLLFAEKSMYKIKMANKYDILAELIHDDLRHREVYEDLQNALLFFETFRFLYHLLVIQEEEISLVSEESVDNLSKVAEYMGYSKVGCIDAYERLLTRYFEYIQMAKDKTIQIFELVTKHLQSISVFSQMSKKKSDEKTINIAEELANLTHFFRGTKFWDDVIITLESNGLKTLKRLVSDFAALSDERKGEVIEHYIELSRYSFHALLSLIMVMTKHMGELSGNNLVHELNDSFFENITGTPDELRRLSKVFSYYPQLLNDYIASLSTEKKEKLRNMLKGDVWEDETRKFKGKLENLANLHCCISHYCKRFFDKVVNNYPEYILYLDETDTLKHIAEGVLGEVERHSDIKKKKQLLGDYYDIEFLRTGVELLKGRGIAVVNTEFTEFSDSYLRMLFDVCRMEIEEEWVKQIATSDLLALYVSGGHGRGQAFDDDYDLIVLLDTEDPELFQYSSKIISRMNAEIIKRGILPHFRFAEYSGNYVTLIKELKSILTSKDKCTFINKAQILGSRHIVGSTIFEDMFYNEIINPYIFMEKDSFTQEMLHEMKDRHSTKSKYSKVNFNIKECLGGLRDIEMFFLILKSYFHIRDPISENMIQRLCKIDEVNSNNYTKIKRVFDNLKHLRDVYRLTVSADDELDPEYLKLPAKILNISSNNSKEAGQILQQRFDSWTRTANKIIENTLEKLHFCY